MFNGYLLLEFLTKIFKYFSVAICTLMCSILKMFFDIFF